MIKDGLLDSFNDYHMGVTAENVAEKYKISRDEQDNFSLNSQKKTEKAYSENKFKDELIKLQIEDGDKKFIFEKDFMKPLVAAINSPITVGDPNAKYDRGFIVVYDAVDTGSNFAGITACAATTDG